MSKFSRSWTQQLSVDKQSFSDAFFKVVKANDIFWLNRKLYEPGEDCKGEIKEQSFSIYKRTYNDSRISVEGRIQEDKNGITLVLEMNSFINPFFNAVTAFFYAIIALVAGLLLKDISNIFNTAWLILFCYFLPVFAIAYWLIDRSVQVKLNEMQNFYIAVVNEIEKQAMAGKHK